MNECMIYHLMVGMDLNGWISMAESQWLSVTS